ISRRLEFLIGLNPGDVVVEGADLLGDGVNIAARLQEAAAPAGICLSGAVREQIEGKLDFPIAALGERRLKNIPRAVPIFRVDWGVDAPTVTAVLGGGGLALPDKPSIAVWAFAALSGSPAHARVVAGLPAHVIAALA